jgi:hypothetical protein
VHVPSHESEQSCMCVLEVSILPLIGPVSLVILYDILFSIYTFMTWYMHFIERWRDLSYSHCTKPKFNYNNLYIHQVMLNPNNAQSCMCVLEVSILPLIGPVSLVILYDILFSIYNKSTLINNNLCF